MPRYRCFGCLKNYRTIDNKEINKRSSEVVFSLPEVKVGSIIEYKYTVEGSGSNNWYFQKSIPVMLSRYTINVPIEFEIACIQHCTLPVSSVKNEKGGKEIQTFSMEKIPALRDEAFISCEDYTVSHETDGEGHARILLF